MVVSARIIPDGDMSFHGNSIERHLWQASLGGYCISPHPLQHCKAKRPSEAAALNPRDARLRDSGGLVGKLVLFWGLFFGAG